MKISDVTNAADGLDPKNRASITSLIDTKIESDMKEAITMMRGEFSSIRNEIASLKTELVHVENKISTGYTFFGIALGVISAVLAILGIMVAMLVFRHPL